LIIVRGCRLYRFVSIAFISRGYFDIELIIVLIARFRISWV